MSSPASTDPPPPTRARDLRQALIDAGVAILAEEGLEKLTLRRVAARVGVSHAAPAHHFRGLPHLLGCICAVGFEGLTAAMDAARRAAPRTPHARLTAICEGYVAFALANPGMMHLMFDARRGEVDAAAMAAAGDAAYRVLREECAAFEPVGRAPDSTETLIWSVVHGLALLRLGGRFDRPFRATATPEVADVLPALPLRAGGAAES